MVRQYEIASGTDDVNVQCHFVGTSQIWASLQKKSGSVKS
jgi:hypothetical protein